MNHKDWPLVTGRLGLQSGRHMAGDCCWRTVPAATARDSTRWAAHWY